MDTCSSVEEAHELFGLPTADNGTRLVLCPGRSCCSWFITVPSGMFALLYKQGRFVKKIDPGLHVLNPLYSIKYLVTQQVVVFDAPVKNCPTKDNVMASIDILLVFHIIDPEKFVFRLGPGKLDEYLRSSQEEAIRGLARTISYKEAYTLSGRSTADMVASLNAKLGEFGVEVLNVTITDVRLPAELAKALENATTMSILQREQQMRQKYDMLVIENKSILDRKEEQLKNERIAADKESEKKRAEMTKELELIEGRKSALVADILASQNSRLSEISAQANLECGKCAAERDKFAQSQMSEVAASLAAMEMEKSSYVETTLSTARLQVAKDRATSSAFDSEVEADSTEKVRKRREFDLENKRIEILEALSTNSTAVIAGAAGVLSVGTVVETQSKADVRSRAVSMAMDVVYGPTSLPKG